MDKQKVDMAEVNTLQAAKLLGLAPNYVSSLIRSGKLLASKRGGRDWWIKLEDVQNLKRRPRGRPRKN